jgi:hypothetical protein
MKSDIKEKRDNLILNYWDKILQETNNITIMIKKRGKDIAMNLCLFSGLEQQVAPRLRG